MMTWRERWKMEAFFLGCFLFGALFTVASVLLGFAGSALHIGGAHDAGLGSHGDFGHIGHVGDVGHGSDVGQIAHGGPGGHSAGVAHGVQAGEPGGAALPATHAPGAVHAGGAPHGTGAALAPPGLPIFNVSALLAFVTWFGAGGYVLLRFLAWPLLAALGGAVVGGVAGAVLIALFLRTVLAGERVLNPQDYRLEGTIARVTVGIPSDGTGEIVFAKAGSRRSEAARSRSGRPIPRGQEVVIIDYARGVAHVEPWDELVAEGGSGKRA